MWLPVGFRRRRPPRVQAGVIPQSRHLPPSFAGEDTLCRKMPSSSCTTKISFYFSKEAGKLLLSRVSYRCSPECKAPTFVLEVKYLDRDHAGALLTARQAGYTERERGREAQRR